MPGGNEFAIEQNDTYYTVFTDWMKFYFSKKDFQEEDVRAILPEAVSVMGDIRAYLSVNYTPADAAGSECYFDSTYRYLGAERSSCQWAQKRLDCVRLEDFVHEYVHLVSERNADLAFHPSGLFREGLAEYVSLNFHDGIASQEYLYFKEPPVAQSSSPAEHETVCRLLSEKGLPYTAKNYKRAYAALLDRNYDITKLNQDSDFYKYDIGFLFVDYCIEHGNGMQDFLSVYCDSFRISEVYGKTTDELVIDACSENTKNFYG